MVKVIQHIYFIPILLSAILSLKAFRHHWPLPYRIFSCLLILILLIETFAITMNLLGYFLTGWYFSQPKLWLYNSFLVPQYLLYMAVYYHAIRSVKIKKLIVIIALIFTLLAISNLLFFQSFNSVNSITLLMASGIVLFLTITWFEQLRKEEKVIAPLTANPMAWISLGAFLFHATFLPYILGLNYLNRTDISLAIALFYVYLLLNCVMYTLYSIAFLCKTTLQKS